MIEAVFYRYGVVYARECDSLDEAIALLADAADHGTMSDVGVFVDGHPRITDAYVDPRPPTAEEAEKMAEDYRRVQRGDWA